ncbi:MAG: hypothetical protein ACE5J5_06555, partial [Candidatus Hydrothermarchaeales archaeon]
LLKRHAFQPLLEQEDELEALIDAKDSLSKEFDCSVEVVKAEESTADKASRAEPGKPGIEIE